MSISKTNIYAVKDIKSQLFSNPPYFIVSDGVAIRSFSSACLNPESDFSKYPSDYSLYHIGEYDLESGQLNSLTPRQIANASEFKNVSV